MNNNNTNPPLLAQQYPVYPHLTQVCRVTGGTIPGPSGYMSSSAGGPSLYLAYTQQMDPRTVQVRDREPCLVADLNNIGLGAGFYECRLGTNYNGLPVYEACEQARVGGDTFITYIVINNIVYTITNNTYNYITNNFNYTNNTFNYYQINNVIINQNSVFLITGDGYVVIDAPLNICGWMFWCYVDYTVNTAELIDWALPGTPNDGEAIVFRLSSTGPFAIASILHAPPPLGSQTETPGDVGPGGWANATGIFHQDGNYASKQLAAGATSGKIIGDAYGFSIPAGATITGIVVHLAYARIGPGHIASTFVRLRKAGVDVGTGKTDVTDWPLAGGDLSLGSSSDLWGTTWTAADINSLLFGVGLTATATAAADVTALLDVIEVIVYYQLVDAGQVIALANVSAYDMTLLHESPDGTGQYCLNLENATNKIVKKSGIVLLWYDPGSSRWRAFRPEDVSSGGSTITHGETVLNSNYTVASASWADTGLNITIPSAGTWLIEADISANITVTNAVPAYISVRLYKVTSGAEIQDTTRVACEAQVVSVNARGNARLSRIITTTGSENVRVEAEYTATGTVTAAAIVGTHTGAEGGSLIRYLQLG